VRSGALPLAVQRLLRHLGIFLLVVGFVLLIFHAIAGKYLVASIYDGALTPARGHLIFKDRGVHDVDHYYTVVNRRVLHLLAAIVALALALLCVPVSSQRLPSALFAVDLLFMAADRTYGLRFSVSTDGGYPELFQYLKEAGISLGFLVLYRRRPCGMYLVWSTLFAYLLADDALMIHETLGFNLSRDFHFPSVMGLRPEDLGELLVIGSVGTLFLTSLFVTYRTAPSFDKRVTWSMLALLGSLALFGVGFDMVEIILDSEWVKFLENAGEMVAMSAIVWYIYHRLVNTRLARVG
jgi:hypothetical protein